MKSEEEIKTITNAVNENIQIMYSQSVIDDFQAEIKQLKKENEELKEERLEIARLFDKTCRCDDLKEDNAKCQYFNEDCISIRHCMKKFRSLKDNYKQALEKIREIAKKINEGKCISVKDGECSNKDGLCWNDPYISYSCGLDKILDKINEVLND